MRRFGRRGMGWVAAMAATLLTAGLTPAPAHAAGDEPLKLDVLFVGAHPDDETFAIPSFGMWGEYDDVTSGVLTVTRGEGGGNAIGPEEGEPLGLLREAEERRAVGHGGVEDIFYLDDVDFFYTVSAPLTEELWGHRASLSRTVRIIRRTRPEVIMTMNPSPTPGNHGNHQYAARLAVEAFYAAADPKAFPAQIKREGLRPWTVKRIVQEALATVGPDAVAGTIVTEAGAQTPVATNEDECSRAEGTDPTDVVFNVWRGRYSRENGTSWAVVGSRAANEYASQGFSGPIAAAFGAFFLGFCDQLTEIDSRVPTTLPARGEAAVFEGTRAPSGGGMPAGSLFYLASGRFGVVGGLPFKVTAHAQSAATLGSATVALTVPDGWTVTGDGDLGTLPAQRDRSATFTVTPPAGAAPGRVRLGAELTVGDATATTVEPVQVIPAVRATLAPLPHVAEFRTWARANAPALDNLLLDRQSIGTGETRTIGVTLTNDGNRTETGDVSLTVPAGFEAEPATIAYDGLAAGARQRVDFRVTNTDASLATSNDGGDYPVTVTATSTSGESTEPAALNLVPVTSIPEAVKAPAVDGTETVGEYTGDPLDLDRQWEGTAPPLTPLDASGSAKLMRTADALYLVVQVTDNRKGAVLTPSDCKRHWRTDSVEIAIDPRSGSENTSTTFKAAVLPETDDPQGGNPPCFSRDADNHQGPGAETAPGMQVASSVSSPYRGYTIEAKIPFSVLPAAIDPTRMGFNLFIYDSDTTDKTGLHRLGWSTWGGVQGDPYRWGHATLPGYTAPAGMPTQAPAPKVPDTAAQSIASPQSILQSVRNDVPPGGHQAAGPGRTALIRSATISGEELVAVLETRGPGTAHLFAHDGDDTLAHTKVVRDSAGVSTVRWQLDAAQRLAMEKQGSVLLGFATPDGGTVARSLRVGETAASPCTPTRARGFRRVQIRGGRKLRVQVVRRLKRSYRFEIRRVGGKRVASRRTRAGRFAFKRSVPRGSYRLRVQMRLPGGEKDTRQAAARLRKSGWKVGKVRRLRTC